MRVHPAIPDKQLIDDDTGYSIGYCRRFVLGTGSQIQQAYFFWRR